MLKEELRLRNQHKAQSSVEFVILITFILIMFTVITILIQSRISEANQVKNNNYAKQIKNIVFNEVKIAESMPIDYTKEFILPLYIEGKSYTIDIIDGTELIINYKDKEYVYFLLNDFNNYSYIEPGMNIITKKKYDNNIVYGFNSIYYNADCNGYYDGENCWIIIGDANCNGRCNSLGNWKCDPGWEDENCEILENRFKIKCDICDKSADLKYPAYDLSGDTITCYSGTGSATCNAQATLSIPRLCGCVPN